MEEDFIAKNNKEEKKENKENEEKKEEKVDNDDESGLCRICLDKTSAVMFENCSHICLCKECSVAYHKKECIMCRKYDTGRREVFLV